MEIIIQVPTSILGVSYSKMNFSLRRDAEETKSKNIKIEKMVFSFFIEIFSSIQIVVGAMG